MGRAEDAIRRRQQEAADADLAAQLSVQQRRTYQRQKLIAEVDRLVPDALRGLEAAGWPGGTLLPVQKLFRKKQIAGFVAGAYEFRNKEGYGANQRNPLFLLSDGSWMYGVGSKPTSFRSIVNSFAGGMDRPYSLLCSELPTGVIETLRKYAAMLSS